MEIELKLDNGEVFKETVAGGHLLVFPLGTGRSADVKIKCKAGASVNGKRSVKLHMIGGTAGLIFDARGRPLPLARDIAGRAAQIPQWIHEATDQPLLEIRESWLQEIEEIEEIAEAPAIEELVEEAEDQEEKPAKKRRRGLFGRRGKKEDKETQDEAPDLEEPDLESDDFDDLRSALS